MIKYNPKYFFSYCKRYSKAKTQIGPLKNATGTIEKDPAATSDLLLQQYNSVLSCPCQHEIVQNPGEFFAENPKQLQITDLDITAEDIQSAIKELRPNTAAGADGVPTMLLLNCRNTLAKPLLGLWKKSLDTGITPELLKTGTVSPIYKGGDRCIPKNDRPVALTSHLIKIFENECSQQYSEVHGGQPTIQ
ncbi:uncharacterized protein LOC143041301 [Oratosquilla oratoria]|uniref:uncharacterized protein LOC143041301 n=1 Tax=Oratosquilla oratoria TaxID=337810 RepID=UPI003F774DB1